MPEIALICLDLDENGPVCSVTTQGHFCLVSLQHASNRTLDRISAIFTRHSRYYLRQLDANPPQPIFRSTHETSGHDGQFRTSCSLSKANNTQAEPARRIRRAKTPLKPDKAEKHDKPVKSTQTGEDEDMVEASEEENSIPNIKISIAKVQQTLEPKQEQFKKEPSPTPSFLDSDNLSDIHSGYDSSSTTKTDKKPKRNARVPRHMTEMTEMVSDSDDASSSKRRAESDADQPARKRKREGTGASFDGRAYRRDGVSVPAGLENPFRRPPTARSFQIDEQEDMRNIREGIEKSDNGLEPAAHDSPDTRHRSKTPARRDILSPKRNSRKQNDVDENDDHCSTCRGTTGDLICCDDCPKAFHGYCCDPPIDPQNLPEGSWSCKTCELRKKSVAAPTVGRHPWKRGVWTALLEKLNFQAIKIFKLPPSISNAFASSARNPASGDYIDLTEYSIVPRFSGISQQTLIENLRKEAATAICFKCCRSGASGAPGSSETLQPAGYLAGVEPVIIRCDYCPLWWHLDCLDPPLTHLVNVSTFPLDEALHESELGAQHSPPKRGRKQMASDVASDDRKLHDLAFGTDTYWTQGIVSAPATTGHALGLRRRWMCPCHSTWEQRKVDTLLQQISAAPTHSPTEAAKEADDLAEADTHVVLKETFDVDSFREQQPKLFPHRYTPAGPLTFPVPPTPSQKPWNHGEIGIVNDDGDDKYGIEATMRGVNGNRGWARFLVDDHEFEVSEARVKMEFLNKCHEYVSARLYKKVANLARWEQMKEPQRTRARLAHEFLSRFPDDDFVLTSNVFHRSSEPANDEQRLVRISLSIPALTIARRSNKHSGWNPFQHFNGTSHIISIHHRWNHCALPHWDTVQTKRRCKSVSRR